MEGKKNRERAVLHEFRRLSHDLPPVDAIDGESPDFLLQHTEGVLGVEIEEFVRGQGRRGSPDREREKFRDNVAKRSQQRFEESSSIPIQVLLTWWPWIPPKADPNLLAQTISTMVANHIPTNIYDESRIDPECLEGTAIEKHIHSITVTRLWPAARPSWSAWDIGWAGTVPNEIQELINRKEDKIAVYRQKCDDVWLVIAAGLVIHLSSHVALAADVTDHAYVTTFDRVYLVDFATSRCVLLAIRDPNNTRLQTRPRGERWS